MGVYQQIRDKFIMKNAREDWASYRDGLTDLVLGLLEAADPASGRVLIIGAGRCNDIDLRRLAVRAEKVILLDVDGDAMEEAAIALPEELRRKVECQTASVTGISGDDMDAFCDEMLSFARASGRELTSDTLRRHLMAGLDGLEDKLVRSEDDLGGILQEESADILVCSGVCSQYFSSLSFFLRSFIHSLQEVLTDVDALEQEVHTRIHGMDDIVIPVINRAFCRAARKAIVFGNEFMPDRPVEGAHRCIEDVRMHLRPEETHLLWDFNRAEGIGYDMLIQICRL